jgi:hypothetical protein
MLCTVKQTVFKVYFIVWFVQWRTRVSQLDAFGDFPNLHRDFVKKKNI